MVERVQYYVNLDSMDVEKLLAELGREVTEKELSRDDLMTHLFAVSEEIRELGDARETVTKLLQRYASSDDWTSTSDVVTAAPAAPAAEAVADGQDNNDVDEVADEVDELAGDEEAIALQASKDLQVPWPVGPHYQKQFKAKKRQAWARYKLGSADWYLSTLESIAATVPKLDRLVGVEMAIDGTIQSLCATFDAAVYALTSALEAGANLPREKWTPAHLATWSNLTELAGRHGLDLESASAVNAALIGDRTESPDGWLAQLFLLRHRSAQHDLLIRHWLLGGADPVVHIDVPGQGPRPPLEYLTEVRVRVEELLEVMLEDQEMVRRGRIYPIDRVKSADRELPDLLRRAHVTP